MSRKKRWFYFLLFLGLFVVITPMVILYAAGYRLDSLKNLVISERGGMYVYSQIPGTGIYVDDEFKEETGIFNREYKTSNLKPNRYFVKAVHEGYLPWEKYITIDPQRVVSLYPFLVPEEFEILKVPRFVEVATSTSATTSSTIDDVNPRYDALLDIFITKGSLSTTTPTVLPDEAVDSIKRVFGKIEVWHEGNDFVALWGGRGDWMPSYFCENGECANPLVFLTVTSPITNFNFYPGRDDVVIFSVEDGGVYVAEIDKRPKQVVAPIYRGGTDVEFRLEGNSSLIIKDGENLFTVKL